MKQPFPISINLEYRQHIVAYETPQAIIQTIMKH